MCDALRILYHLYNFKNVKNTHGGVLLLVKLQVLAIAQMGQLVPNRPKHHNENSVAIATNNIT